MMGYPLLQHGKPNRWLKSCLLLLVLVLTCQGVCTAAIIESGDLNIIDDPGNPSDGLRYLNMTYSEGKRLAAALADARAVYPNARAATPSEFDDLFAAAGIGYDDALTASDAFTTGAGNIAVSSGLNYNSTLFDALGQTDSIGPDPATLIWTDPDGSLDVSTTRDFLTLYLSGSTLSQSSATPASTSVILGWLLVSEPPQNVIPAPGAFALVLTGVVSLRGFRRRRQSSRR